MLRTRALDILGKMDFGKDGYFFVYDMHGRSLMHPREPDLVGRDLWTMRDPQGALVIQQLIAAAARGGGYVRYVWHRPSTGKLAPTSSGVTLSPTTIAPALFASVLWVLVFLQYRESFNSIFSAKRTTQE